ncbi:MAG: hypothetical protein HY447_00290 [Candidatus Omnitrophica bacterium]|nr:hypothetical protein [Candidatus Omnitrophota bacterium]
MRSRLLILIFLLVGIAALAVGYELVQSRLRKQDVIDFLQAKASEILKTKVKIGQVSYLPPFRVALQGIQMDQVAGGPGFSIGKVEKLILGYGLFNLARFDFKIPSTVVLVSPQIHFQKGRFPFPIPSSDSSSSITPAKLVISRGDFHYPWGEDQDELVFSRVEFKAKPDIRGRIQLNLAGQLEGIAQGKIKIKGFTDTAFKHYELEIQPESVSFLPESRIPLKGLDGAFRLTDQSIQIEDLKSLLYDWEVDWTGRIENWQTEPKISMDMTHKKGKFPFQFSIQVDLKSHTLEGEGAWVGRTYPFRGQVSREGKSVLFSKLELPHDYKGKGEFDWESGDYHLQFDRERRRFDIHSNLKELVFQTEFQLDHASINHLDWVVLGQARFTPLAKRASDEGPRLKGEIKTNYLIVEYEPFEDFQGSFELSAEGVDAINCKWGVFFDLGGRILFKGGEVRQDLVLRVNDFPLMQIQDFAGRPVPSNLSGELEGKLKLRGELKKPEVQGYFTIKDGTIDKLEFDRMVIQFQDFPPYLPLYDSKVFRGRNTLQLTGAIDLRLQNFFHGIQIKGPDHLVIWKGISANWKEGESAIEGEKPLKRKISMGFEVGAGATENQKDDTDEAHALLGPKVRF